MGYAIAQDSKSLQIIVKRAPNLLDGPVALDTGKYSAQMRLPESGIMTPHKHLLPENEVQIGDYLAGHSLPCGCLRQMLVRIERFAGR